MITYHTTADRPELKLWILDDDGTLIDFSSGYTFSLKIGVKGQAAIVTKTTGITGAAGSGTETSGTPNVTIAWAAGELDLTPNRYTLQLTATSGGLDRVFTDSIQIVDVVV